MMAAYFAIGSVYGVMANQAGIPLWMVSAMSVFVYSGATQFAAVGLTMSGSSLAALLTMACLISLRHLILGGTMAPHLSGTSPWKRAVLAFGLTDEAYGLTITKAQNGDLPLGYLAGVMVGLYASWNAAGIFGAVAGAIITDPTKYGLDFVFPACFIGLVVPSLKKLPDWTAALLGAVLALTRMDYLPGSGYLLVAGLIGPLAGLLITSREGLEAKNG